MPKLYQVEQFANTKDLEARLNQLAQQPGDERYRPILFTETTENFTVIFQHYKPPFHRQ